MTRTVIRGGLLADGTGRPAVRADIAVDGDVIAAVGQVRPLAGDQVVEADGLLVTPGLINPLSHSHASLLRDGRGLSELYQGVTTQVFGEGTTLGPVTGRATKAMVSRLTRIKDLPEVWPSVAGQLRALERRGVGFNVASFVGAANLRLAQAGTEARPLTAEELDRAAALLASELDAGALGVGSALIYPPGAFADTGELLRYARVLAPHEATYISHIRSEGDRLLESIGELIEIARDSGARAEVYHLKAVGRANWPKLAQALDAIDAARAEGVRVTANIYPYEAASTGLVAAIPLDIRADASALAAALTTAGGRDELKRKIATSSGWENLYELSGGADGVLVPAPPPGLGPIGDGTLAQLALRLGEPDPLDAMFRILAADPATRAIYFVADKAATGLVLQRPWVSVGSDAEAVSIEDVEAGHVTHPRAFGAFATVLSVHARDERVIPVAEAVRRMTSLPAQTFGLAGRGVIRPGAFADIAVMDLPALAAPATYDRPAQYASGVRHVFVNGIATLADAEPTGLLPGRQLRRRR
ncbi:N-acyl-D-amino-acid deacylase family protein [Jiangella anatolica]|uniref:N-acyl-D-amino acid deacylase n=1 Tax=Jiangella anatolica TaxID=2670374 RepID=A0A2W2CN60_9ACTN|nr:amidohydrolase family protein [Jiangella anatolica]PZF86636.1 N-acyl-D-amino acid deacylase [Jiangella anatolica]